MAHREFCKTCTTTACGAFAAANSADSLSSNQPNSAYQQETIDAIANIASATAHNRECVATLTVTVITLITKLASTNAKLIQALVKTTKLVATVGELRHTTPKTRYGGQHYFWSCGYVSTQSS